MKLPRADPARRFGTKHPTSCGVCRRRAGSWGSYGRLPWPRASTPILWLCDNPDCLAIGDAVYKMTAAQMDELEAKAILDAGAKAGAYLDHHGAAEVPLMSLPPEVWDGMITAAITGFEESLRSQIATLYGAAR